MHLRNFSIGTDRTINANRPDNTAKECMDKTYRLIDMSVPADRNFFSERIWIALQIKRRESENL